MEKSKKMLRCTRSILVNSTMETSMALAQSIWLKEIAMKVNSKMTIAMVKVYTTQHQATDMKELLNSDYPLEKEQNSILVGIGMLAILERARKMDLEFITSLQKTDTRVTLKMTNVVVKEFITQLQETGMKATLMGESVMEMAKSFMLQAINLLESIEMGNNMDLGQSIMLQEMYMRVSS